MAVLLHVELEGSMVAVAHLHSLAFVVLPAADEHGCGRGSDTATVGGNDMVIWVRSHLMISSLLLFMQYCNIIPTVQQPVISPTALTI